MPLCTFLPERHNPETPVDQSNNIVDLSSVGLKQLWNLRVHLQEASTLATAHYPEILDRVFVSTQMRLSYPVETLMDLPQIVGAPSFFPVVWGWIKKWFDPITTSKIFILAQHDVLPTLSTFIKVEDIPRKYGGELDFEYGKLPNLDPDIRKHMTIEPTGDAETFFIASPIRWIDAGEGGKDGDMTALSVGNLNGKQRKEPVAVLHLGTDVGTQSKNFQSQRTETTTLPSRPATSNDQSVLQNGLVPNGYVAPQTGAAIMGQVPSQSQPVSNGHLTPTSQPTSEQLVPGNDPIQHPVANGGPPESKPQNLSMPPPPTDMEGMKAGFFTPPSDPSEVKQLA